MKLQITVHIADFEQIWKYYLEYSYKKENYALMFDFYPPSKFPN